MEFQYLRRPFHEIHLWLGIVSGFILFVVCLSGTILVFQTECRRIAEPARYFVDVSAGEAALSVDELIAKVETAKQEQGLKVTSITIPEQPNRTVSMSLTVPGMVPEQGGPKPKVGGGDRGGGGGAKPKVGEGRGGGGGAKPKVGEGRGGEGGARPGGGGGGGRGKKVMASIEMTNIIKVTASVTLPLNSFATEQKIKTQTATFIPPNAWETAGISATELNIPARIDIIIKDGVTMPRVATAAPGRPLWR